MKAAIFAIVIGCVGSTFADEPKLVAWQTAYGFAKDTTVEAVRFAETNGFDCVRLRVTEKTDLAPLFKAAGGRLDVWVEFANPSESLAKRVMAEMEKAGLGPERVILSSDKRWFLKELKSKYASCRLAWPCRVDYYYPSYNWGVFGWTTGPVVCSNIEEVAAEIEKFAAAHGVWGVQLSSRRFITDPKVVKHLQSKGFKVIVDEVNDPITGDYYRQAGADALVTALPAYTRGGSWPKGSPKKVKYIGHRGGEDYHAPQHTLAMAELAAKRRLDMVKLDIHWTKDGEIVTHHDHTLKRVFGVDKMIREHDYAELSQYEAIPVNCISNQHLATFRQVLDVVKNGVGEFWLDFKDFTPACADKTMKIVDEAGVAHSRVMVATYSEPALAYMQEHYPDVRRVMHVTQYLKAGKWYLTYHPKTFESANEVVDELIRRKRKYDLYGFNLPGGINSFGTFRTEWPTIEKLKRMGLWIAIYFPVDPISADYYRRAGVDAFVTGCARACEVLGLRPTRD